jgi:hypothetical protein
VEAALQLGRKAKDFKEQIYIELKYQGETPSDYQCILEKKK